MRKVLFSYRHVNEVPLCPCSDPDNNIMPEPSISDPLDLILICWCGRTCRGKFDSMEERAAFLIKNKVDPYYE